jgi:HEPN domain-containing protein
MSDDAGWVASADIDLDAARRCLADPPNVAAAAYHCQQAAEKLIKAVWSFSAVVSTTMGRCPYC